MLKEEILKSKVFVNEKKNSQKFACKSLIFACFAFGFLISIILLSYNTEAKTITVDASGGGDHEKIQDAINASNNSDIIEVYPGKYYENVKVNKTLTIISNSGNPEDTIVNASDSESHVIEIIVDWVNISGFSMENATGEDQAGIYISGGKYCNISDNIATNNFYGIFIYSSYNKITTNFVYNNSEEGIYLDYASDNQLISNYIYNNSDDGIYLYESSFNEIVSCYIYNNSEGINSAGIRLWNSDNNTISSNQIYENFGHGIYIRRFLSCNNTVLSNHVYKNAHNGIYVFESINNSITGNIIHDNFEHGIHIRGSNHITVAQCNSSYNNGSGIYLSYAHNNTIEDNILIQNIDKGVYSSGNGIILTNSNDNKICNNTALLNEDSGIQLYANSRNNFIYNNSVSYNNLSGILLLGGSDQSNWCNFTKIINNTAFKNNRSGISIGSEIGLGGGGFLEIHYNTLYENKYHGIILNDGSSENIIKNCNIYNNTKNGIHIEKADNNTVFNNTIIHNNYGIYLDLSDDNLIYNNYFNNTNNAYDDGKNIWNISKMFGLNIIDGPFLGGNYWSNYGGDDTDNDGLGDTNTPHDSNGNILNGGDFLPLTISKVLSVHNIDTGENFSKVQYAIDDSDTKDGHTILVDSGTYYENIVINKEISLINGSNPIINGMGKIGINITANNVTIDGFNITNCNEAIWQHASGIEVINTTFWLNNHAFWWDIEEKNLESDVILYDTLFNSNFLYFDDSGEDALAIEIELQFNNTDNDVFIGEITYINNEFHADNTNTDHMNIEPFEITGLDGGSITIGDITYSENRVYGGDEAIDFFGEIEKINNVTVSIGDFIVTDNIMIDQEGTSVYIDYFDIGYWYGTTIGTFGDLIITNNVAKSVYNADGLYVSDYAYWQELYDDSSFTVGNVNISDNDVDLFGDAIYLSYSYSGYWLYNDSYVSMGNAFIQNNIIYNSSTGINVEVESIGEMYDNASGSMGLVDISYNIINASSKGIDFYAYELGYYMYDSTSVMVGDFFINDNIFNGEGTGIYADIEYLGYEMYDTSTCLLGDIHILRNEVTSSDNNGIHLYYFEDVGSYIYNDTFVEMGDLLVNDNEVHSEDIGIYGEDMYNLGYEMYGNAIFIMGDIQFCNNTINSTNSEGFYFDDLTDWGSYLYDNANATMGSFLCNDNKVHSYDDGLYLYAIEDCGVNMHDDSIFKMENIEFCRNTFNSTDEYGMYIDYLEYIGEYIYDRATCSIGSILFQENTITSDETGLYIYEIYEIGYQMYNDSFFEMGDIEFTNNWIDSGDHGIHIEDFTDFGYNLHESAYFTMGDIVFNNNYIDCDENGFYFEDIDDFGWGMYDNSYFEMGDIEFINNYIDCWGYGICFDEFEDFGYIMEDEATVIMGDILFNLNTIDSGDHGMYFESWVDWGYNMKGNSSYSLGDIEFTKNNIDSSERGIYISTLENFGYEMYGNAQFNMEDFIIQDNNIMTTNEGLYLGDFIIYFGYDMEDNASFIMGNILINNNNISSDDEDGIYLYWMGEFGEYMYDNSSYLMGDIQFNNNEIWSGDDGMYLEYPVYDFGVYMYDQTTFKMGNVTINRNHIDSENYGLYLYWIGPFGWDMHGDSVMIMGDFQVNDNVIDCTENGIYFYEVEIGGEMYDNSQFFMDDFQVNSNEVFSTNGSGIVFEQGEYIGYEMYNHSLVFLENIEFSYNNINALNDGIFLDFSNFSKSRYNESYLSIDMFTIEWNDISNAKGFPSGIHLNNTQNATVYGNSISNSSYSIYMWNCSNISIINNDILNNEFGIFINGSSYNNKIYHNNLIDNSVNAYDNGSNIWDDGYPSGGNYWSDFDEESEGAYDNDSDGIVDSPYNIQGKNNQDRFPLISYFDYIPPVADAGIDQIVPEGSEVILDGSESSDNIGIVNWTWTFIYNEVFQTLYGEISTFTFLIIGNYEITLTVKDAFGLRGIDIVWINITDDTPPTAVAGSDQEVTVGTEVTFNGSDSTDNIGVVNWTWTFDDNGFKILYGETPKYKFNNIGNFKVTLTVKDAVGLISIDKIWIIVTEIEKTEIIGPIIVNLGTKGTASIIGAVWGNLTLNASIAQQPDQSDAYAIGIYLNITTKGDGLLEWLNISINYKDLQQDIDETKLRIYYWNETTNKWDLIENSGIDTNKKIIWANITHLTIFAPRQTSLPEVKDTEPPKIEHTPIISTKEGEDVKIEATIIDNVKVDSVKLYWRKKGETSWRVIDMVKEGENKYYAIIPKELVDKDIEYYILATDGINEITLPKNIDEPYVIEVEKEEEKSPMIYVVIPIIVIILIIIGFLFIRKPKDGKEEIEMKKEGEKIEEEIETEGSEEEKEEKEGEVTEEVKIEEEKEVEEEKDTEEEEKEEKDIEEDIEGKEEEKDEEEGEKEIEEKEGEGNEDSNEESDDEMIKETNEEVDKGEVEEESNEEVEK